ncbi:hypothetical protein ACP70R_007541 [Stipagrostis hirtigluma subsp. patula]
MASFHALTASCVFFVFVLLSGAPKARSQQPYGYAIADCGDQHNSSGLLGYFCNSSGEPSCETFLTFNLRPPYADLASVAALLGADAASLAAANGVAAPGTKVLVPATCSCTATAGGRFYQRNATYVARPGDTLLAVAKDTFQGLSTCQAVRAQGLGGAPPESLLAGQELAVPLRCACPTAAQAAAGARFLVSYLVVESDDLSSIAGRFGVDVETLAAANELQAPYTIFPFTTLLIPVKSRPDISQLQSPPPPPPPVAAPPPANKSSNHAGVYIGIAVGVAAVVAIAIAGAFLARKARRKRAGAVEATGELAKKEDKGNDKSTSSAVTGGEFSISISEAFSSISVSDIKSSLKVYTYAELKAATDDFSPDRRIGGGSVYLAFFNGDAAAVEAVDRDVSTEVEIMRKINHLNLIRLIGLCHHRGQWYLVTEYAEHGALRDRLFAGGTGDAAAPPLSWAQRVQIALDVAEGLRYLHEYARPPCVHMDVSSGSVLLAGEGPRAKLRGFAAARAFTGCGGGGGELYYTMTSRIAGMRGYMAPEYLQHGVVSPKADVYSLGVVLLELVTGKDAEELVGDGVGDPFAALRALASDHGGGGGDDDDEEGGDAALQRLEELVDPAMPAGSCPQDAVAMMVRLIERCVRRDAASRPSTGEVAQCLVKLSGVLAISWQGSPESPRSPGR